MSIKYKREPNENSRLKGSIWSEKKYMCWTDSRQDQLNLKTDE